jgi:GNAT superfamily N-acetyltransferase
MADIGTRARAWRRAQLAAVCDVIVPWAHGTIMKATPYPSYWELNLIRVERDATISAEDLITLADDEIAPLTHRTIEIEPPALGEAIRPAFKQLGWRTMRTLWMHHAGAARLPAPKPEPAVEEVPFDAVDRLRTAWHEEDFPGTDATMYHAQAREVALRRGARVLAVVEDGVPIAFAQIERGGAGAEVSEVYVAPAWRGRGLGTAVTVAAIRACSDADEVWISADDEDRPKQLYARLGFRPACTMMMFLREPATASARVPAASRA